MATKAPAKKKPVSKATNVKKKAVVKKVTTKKPVAKKTLASKKKKSPLKRLLEYKISGSVTKKGFFISMGIVVVAVAAFAIYSLTQGNGANAGGVTTLGRTWSYLGKAQISGGQYGINKQGLYKNEVVNSDVYMCKDIGDNPRLPAAKQYVDVEAFAKVTSSNLSPAIAIYAVMQVGSHYVHGNVVSSTPGSISEISVQATGKTVGQNPQIYAPYMGTNVAIQQFSPFDSEPVSSIRQC
jgi:hypothetical protein